MIVCNYFALSNMVVIKALMYPNEKMNTIQEELAQLQE